MRHLATPALLIALLALPGLGRAQDCLPDPTPDCLRGVVVQAFLDRIATPATGQYDFERLTELDQRREEAISLLIEYGEQGETGALDRILAALPAKDLEEISVRLALESPALAADPRIGTIARDRALKAAGPTLAVPSQEFRDALELLSRLGETQALQEAARMTEEGFFALWATQPQDMLDTAKEDVVIAHLQAKDPAAALAFLDRITPQIGNAYQWIKVAEAMVDAGDCTGALAIVDRVPRSELDRMGNMVLPVIADCRGLQAAIDLGKTMPEQELDMFTWPMLEEGRFDDALAVADALEDIGSGWAVAIRRAVARARAEAGEFDEDAAIADLQEAGPYPLARTRAELALAKARAGKADPELTRRAAQDIRKLDPNRLDPYALADLMLLQGFAQTWVPPDPDHLSPEMIEAQLARMTPASRDDALGQLEASEEGYFLALALLAYETALGRSEQASAVVAQHLSDSCGPEPAKEIDCLLSSLRFLQDFAAPGLAGDLPRRIWTLAEPLPDRAERAQIARYLTWALIGRP